MTAAVGKTAILPVDLIRTSEQSAWSCTVAQLQRRDEPDDVCSGDHHGSTQCNHPPTVWYRKDIILSLKTVYLDGIDPNPEASTQLESHTQVGDGVSKLCNRSNLPSIFTVRQFPCEHCSPESRIFGQWHSLHKPVGYGGHHGVHYHSTVE